MEGLAFIFALIYLAFLVYLLVKFIQLCNDTRDIKNLLVANLNLKKSKSSSSEEQNLNLEKSKSSSSEKQNLNKPKFKEGDLVVEKSTQKQLRLGNFYNNSWVCLSNGQEYKNLKEHDLYTWDEYLASIGKK
ncbi:hypothetical protein [Leyella stercorea]|jgi:hypothetical protein|uniref:Uncharacterized protein n=1 Tax=Leyella stercorea TaxID=363265 RepID=A0A415GSJ0_9BACT|nr:hypothetical protein [Leyella stercorea]RHK53316.1 hypothetical protein DW060_00375 [Leyella stercorea]